MDWIEVGKITRPHGLKGELKFYPFITGLEIFREFTQMAIARDEGPPVEMQVESLRGKAPLLIIKLRGTDTIEAARSLCGHTVLVRRGDFAPLPEGEYYWFEIQGLEVHDEDNRYYGRITEIIETGSNDVYVVQDGDKELLLPNIGAVVKTVDPQAGKLVFHPIEGLLEDDPV